jgi:hypothetical protein
MNGGPPVIFLSSKRADRPFPLVIHHRRTRSPARHISEIPSKAGHLPEGQRPMPMEDQMPRKYVQLGQLAADHKSPWARGGKTTVENDIVACPAAMLQRKTRTN